MGFTQAFKIIIFLAILVSLSWDMKCQSTRKSRDDRSPSYPIAVISNCEIEGYVHKSQGSLDGLSATELFQELVKEQAFHKFYTWSHPDHDNEYMSILGGRIRMHGLNVLKILVGAINEYDPKNLSLCADASLDVAADIAVAVDREHSRIRSVPEGKALIESLERKVDEMKKAGFDRPNDSLGSKLDLYQIYLEELKGLNETDKAISDTFWIKKKIKMTQSELNEFSKFLTTRNPNYPSWSKTEFIKDTTRVNEAGNPLQVFVLTSPQSFFEAYLIFKKGRSRDQSAPAPVRTNKMEKFERRRK